MKLKSKSKFVNPKTKSSATLTYVNLELQIEVVEGYGQENVGRFVIVGVGYRPGVGVRSCQTVINNGYKWRVNVWQSWNVDRIWVGVGLLIDH